MTEDSFTIAALFHTMVNLTWQLFPVNGSYYDPRVTDLIMVSIAVIVVIVRGARTLTRYNTVSMKRQA